MRPSPFSAQKTFERHNSRRKSNISFCSNLNMAAAAAAAAAAGSRRGSGFNLSQLAGGVAGGGVAGYGTPRRATPLVTTKSNSLSLPDSPSVVGQTRARSNSLRVTDNWRRPARGNPFIWGYFVFFFFFYLLFVYHNFCTCSFFQFCVVPFLLFFVYILIF